MDVVRLEFFFTDNNGRTASSGLYLSDNISVAAAVAKAQSIGPKLQAISNASLIGATITYNVVFSEINPVLEPCNLLDKLILIFREDANANSLVIPAPRALPYDSTGPYIGVRLHPDTPGVSAALAPLLAALQGTTTQWLEPFPLTFTVGGLTRAQ